MQADDWDSSDEEADDEEEEEEEGGMNCPMIPTMPTSPPPTSPVRQVRHSSYSLPPGGSTEDIGLLVQYCVVCAVVLGVLGMGINELLEHWRYIGFYTDICYLITVLRLIYTNDLCMPHLVGRYHVTCQCVRLDEQHI